jgi:misacylated tRNA(Ala) deacylase
LARLLLVGMLAAAAITVVAFNNYSTQREFETMQKELVQEIEAAINREIANARAVRVKILPREEAFRIPDLIRTKINLLPEGIAIVRTVEIEGLDLQADGGTHVANTREVGVVRVTGYKSKGRINKRIELELS